MTIGLRVLALLALGAPPCGGGGGGGPDNQDPPPGGDGDGGFDQTGGGRVEVSPAILALDVGETATLVATVYDADDQIVAEPVTWQSNGGAASVSENGTVTGVAGGTAGGPPR